MQTMGGKSWAIAAIVVMGFVALAAREIQGGLGRVYRRENGAFLAVIHNFTMACIALMYSILEGLGGVGVRTRGAGHLRVLVRTVGRYVRTRWIWKRGDRRRWPEAARGCPRGMPPIFLAAMTMMMSVDETGIQKHATACGACGKGSNTTPTTATGDDRLITTSPSFRSGCSAPPTAIHVGDQSDQRSGDILLVTPQHAASSAVSAVHRAAEAPRTCSF